MTAIRGLRRTRGVASASAATVGTLAASGDDFASSLLPADSKTGALDQQTPAGDPLRADVARLALDRIAAAVRDLREEERLSFAALLITDINTQNSLLLVKGDPVFIQRISYPHVEQDEIFDMPGVVSRKKQLIPYLTPQFVDYVRQGEPLGLGHAILCARNLVGNDPFAVLLGDEHGRHPAFTEHPLDAEPLRDRSTDELVAAFERLIPQLSSSNPPPTRA